MMGYISFPIESNPALLLQQSYGYIKDRAPQWIEYDGNLDTWILQILASQASDLRILASDVPDTIFRYFGSTILGIPPNSGVQAITHSTWTAIDLNGYLIPAGTLVGIRDAGGVLRGFEVIQDVSILPGLSSTDAGEVGLIATEAGSVSSNIGHSGVQAELIDPLAFVNTITLSETSAGGADAEGIDDYTNRLSEYMRGLSTRPILAEDYARLAMNQPGIYRAVAIDGFDPANDTYNNDKMVTIVALDQFGLDLPTQTKSDLDTMMQSMREVNFVVNVIDASRTPIDVMFEAVAVPNYSTVEVESACIAAVTNYLSPSNWGIDRSIAGSGIARTWVETPFVYYNEIISVLADVQGVDHVTELFINRDTMSPSTNDISLDVPAALTTPRNINGTVIR